MIAICKQRFLQYTVHCIINENTKTTLLESRNLFNFFFDNSVVVWQINFKVPCRRISNDQFDFREKNGRVVELIFRKIAASQMMMC